jgi:hypothetical protein
MFMKLMGVLAYGKLDKKSRIIRPAFDFEAAREELKCCLVRNQKTTPSNRYVDAGDAKG